ncbi:MAG TPA: hypothetical protein VKP88_07885 [Candidatus Paceibacterota bacterium]|nr:hypothetical protein [Candidatus Paceibacterota bacterium]
MKYSLDNYAATGDIGIVNVVDEPAGTEALFDSRVVRSYVATQDGASVTITVEPTTASTVSLVALVGVTGITSVDVECLNATVSQATASGTLSTPVQQTYIVVPISATADEITITFDAGDTNQFSIGYLYVGDLSETLEIASEAMNYRIESANPRNITRAGTAITSDAYLYTQVDFTTQLELFDTLRDRVRLWATDGYATPRLWYFDEACVLTGEAVYGILDSESIQIDPRYADNAIFAELTGGIREVF